MRAFACPHCHALIFFENSVCLSCGSPLGYVRADGDMVVPEPDQEGGPGFVHRAAAGVLTRTCANLDLAGCNWLADDGAAEGLCSCCALTRTRPADDDPAGLAAFARTEAAKRRLVFELDTLGLPCTPRTADPERGLAFDLLSSTAASVTTGHDSGVITIDLAEGDDSHRERMRVSLDEPYRTLLGHLRHEIGHWYWEILVDGSSTDAAFRELFGDETLDYAQALASHYDDQTNRDAWRGTHVSHYAAAHPWEDWAETFAHYLHIRDTLQTAASYGVRLEGVDVPTTSSLATDPRAVKLDDFDAIVDTWLNVTSALNAVNRSMGKDDLYPFVLEPPVLAKLRFVHDCIRGANV